jgi:hypothetical protein
MRNENKRGWLVAVAERSGRGLFPLRLLIHVHLHADGVEA